MIGNVDLFARSGTITVFCIGLIAVVIVAVVNRGDAVRGARSVYSGLIVLGIAMMLATCFGFDVHSRQELLDFLSGKRNEGE